VVGSWRERSVEKLLVADLGGVEVEFDHLGVAGLVGADVLVAGPLQLTALIADGGRRHAGNGRKGRFNSPETAGSKGCFFNAHAFAGWRHVQLMRQLDRGEGSSGRAATQAVMVAFFLALVGLAMAIYLFSIRTTSR
jgi:hypothetical protein